MKKADVKNDQYYTKPSLAKSCIRYVKKELLDANKVIEPSAGSGSFLNNLIDYNPIGFDIDPQSEDVIKQDFLEWENENDDNDVCFIGNPPFGKCSSLAIKFFNHCAEQGAKYICFIVPNTFRKNSVMNRLNLDFHLEREMKIEKDSFELLDGTSYSVPCSFQVWHRKEFKREKVKIIKEIEDWKWVSKEDSPNYAIRRVGANAGKIFEFNKAISNSSHYFIKADPDVYESFKKMFVSLYSKENDNTSKWNTAGNPSLSKHEIIEDYKNFKG